MADAGFSPDPPEGAVGGELRLPRPPGFIRRFWARHPRLVDALIAAVYVLPTVTVAGVGAAGTTPVAPPVWATIVHAAGIIAAGICLLLFRRSRPWVVIAVTWAVCLAVSVTGSVESLPVLLALYGLGVYRSTRAAWIGFAGSVVVAAASSFLAVWLGFVGAIPDGLIDRDGAPAMTSQAFVGMLIATLIGVTVGNRRRYLDALIARAHDLARERDQQARLAAAAERARIAREMHDIVSHGLTVMITLADGSAATATRDPEQAAEGMRTVAEAGREALGDMRRMLGVLDDPDVPAERRPQPDAGGLPDLVDGFRDAGLPVRLTTSGVAPDDSALGLTVYRIVQEGLTNVLRHAHDATRVDVAVAYQGPTVDVVVEDDARAARRTPATTGSGRGLPGVRERVSLYDGSVEAGPRSHAGWRLHATLRVDGDPSEKGAST
ncbi:two-component sensor histidine kinase [Agromyces intestinalis]|uniref:histidine kinase n=1 Tax=Agromyces intestinalis TaxID=2592652 RepID=A0A5C1YKY1_9MICO|nr:histidine kinase [Agromyces intestinalis]QEO15799.1 two-component sensor histidine kinase [Agromyces intestinalis]